MTESTRRALVVGVVAAVAIAIIRPAVHRLFPAENTAVWIFEALLASFIVCAVTLGLGFIDRERR